MPCTRQYLMACLCLWISWLVYVIKLILDFMACVSWNRFDYFCQPRALIEWKFSSDRKSPLPPSSMLENASTVPLNANWWVARNSITQIRGEIWCLFLSIAFELSYVEISLLFVDRVSFSFHMTQHAKWSFESACLGKPFLPSVACFQSRYPFSVNKGLVNTSPLGLKQAWAQFCCKMWGDSLVWNQYSNRVDAEVMFYIYSFPILFLDVFSGQH